MSHTYLITLYELIDQRLEDAAQQHDTDELPDQPSIRFQEGRIDILKECKQFLTGQYNSKLPRRIRNKYR